jgi:hypothetical protein
MGGGQPHKPPSSTQLFFATNATHTGTKSPRDPKLVGAVSFLMGRCLNIPDLQVDPQASAFPIRWVRVPFNCVCVFAKQTSSGVCKADISVIRFFENAILKDDDFVGDTENGGARKEEVAKTGRYWCSWRPTHARIMNFIHEAL